MFYRLIAHPKANTRWFLKAPVDASGDEIDPRDFTDGVPVAVQPPLRLPIRQCGVEVGFNFCDFDMVVTPSTVNEALQALAGQAIQRIPIAVESCATDYEILNVCELIPCVDESRSNLTKWEADDGRPENVGQLRMVIELRIDPSRAAGHHIFRVEEWPIALIVSQQVKALFEAMQLTGVAYQRVD